MWIHARSWIVEEVHADAFLTSLQGVDFWGHGCHGISIDNCWIGEYPWAQVCSRVRDWCADVDDWIRPLNHSLKKVMTHIRTSCEADDGSTSRFVSPQLCDILGLYWGGQGSCFVNTSGDVIARTVRVIGTSETDSLVVKRNKLASALEAEGQRLVWGVLGERRSSNYQDFSDESGFLAPFSAVYSLQNGAIVGGLTVQPYIK